MNSKLKSNKGFPARLHRLFRLACKELLEILRDRRTIITLVLMPLLVYPLLGIVVQKLMLQSIDDEQEIVFNIGFKTEFDAQQFAAVFRVGDAIAKNLDAISRQKNIGGESASSTSEDRIVAVKVEVDEIFSRDKNVELAIFFPGFEPLTELVKKGVYDLGIAHKKSSVGELGGFDLFHNPQSAYSQNAMHYVGRRLRLANDAYVQQLSAKMLLPGSPPANYFEREVEAEPVKPSLLTFIPLMLVLMTITGAVYPAIDLTAGERERGTMEILVAAPVSRFDLLFGKFIAVLTVAMLTACANLLAMMVTIYTLGLDSVVFGNGGVSFTTLGMILLLLLVLAAFFSATLLGLTSFARSFKEAQAYLIPLMMVAFAPGLLSLTPDLQTTSVLAVVPLVNIVLVGRDLLAGNASTALVCVAVISTSLYGLLALSLAAKVFGADSILTGGRTGWLDLFSRSREIANVPTISTAMLLLAVLFPAFIVVAGLTSNFATKLEASIEQRIWANAAITVILFVGLPLTFAWCSHLKIKTTFLLHRPTIMAILSAVLLGSAVWTWAYEIEVASLTSERVNRFFKIFESFKAGFAEIPLLVKLICLAIVPAVCEELTFRGFLLSSFSKKMPLAIAIVATAMLFGLFHVFARDALMFDRLLPSTLMGILLGVVCVRTGSVLPGMLLHVIHNSLLISIAHHEKYLLEFGFGADDQKHLPLYWILFALIPIVIGTLLLFYVVKPKTS